MPLYEYQCGRCGRFELIQKFSDAPLTACPTCGQEVQKLPSAPAIQFKGTGWYITDYARKSTGGEAAGSKDAGSRDTGSKDKSSAGSDASKTSSSASSSTESKSSSSGSGSDKK